MGIVWVVPGYSMGIPWVHHGYTMGILKYCGCMGRCSMVDGARAMDDGRCSMGDLWIWGEMGRERGKCGLGRLGMLRRKEGPSKWRVSLVVPSIFYVS